MLMALKAYLVDGEGLLSPPSMGRHTKQKIEGPVVTADCFHINRIGRHAGIFNHKNPEDFLMSPENPPPVEGCSCGIYGLKLDTDEDSGNIDNLFKLMGYISNSFDDKVKQSAVAKVGMYGKIIEGEMGYRAEKIIIKRLILLTNGRQFSKHFISQMEDRYHVTVSQIVGGRKHPWYFVPSIQGILEDIMRD